MKLNNRGYLLVEVIVASVLAMTIAYFLIDLTMKLANQNDDYVVNTLLETEKVLMTRDVMNDLSKYKLQKIETDKSSYIELTFEPTDDEDNLIKRLTINTEGINYGRYEGTEYIIDKHYVSKKFDEKLKVSSVLFELLGYKNGSYINYDSSFTSLIVDGMVNIKVNAKTIYSDNNYGIEGSINFKLNKNNIIVK